MEVSNGKTRVLVFEWLVGGGLLVDDQPLESCSSMFRQGALMRRAIAEDFAAAGCEVLTTTDSRWMESFECGNSIAISSGGELPRQMQELARETDFLFVVAPESGDRLVQVLKWLEPFAERLLSPPIHWAELFSDKQASCDWLERVGLRVPSGKSWIAGRDSWPPSVPLPAVCKPNDGCGGEGIRLVRENWPDGCDLGPGIWRVESLVEGEPLSVVAVIGAKEQWMLRPTRQLFSGEAFGTYVGGEMVEDEEVVAAVWQAVEPALTAMQGMRGVVGFDLVVGWETGSRERIVTVVEVNPRLTSSYLGLRQYYDTNLANCLLQLVRGEAVEKLGPRNERRSLAWGVE